MYDVSKRKRFKKVGELRAILENLPGDAEIVICGEYGCWFHAWKDDSLICLDHDNLNDYYIESGQA